MIVTHEKIEYRNVNQITFSHDPYEENDMISISLWDEKGDSIGFFSLYPYEFPDLVIKSELYYD
jgi:hypothetical protein